MNFDSVQKWVDAGKPLNAFVLGDCMEGMAAMGKKEFDLAIPDPPYGINAGNVYAENEKLHGNSNALRSAYKIEWDNAPPDAKYFERLFEISNNQIIWGGNYFSLPPTKGLIVWKKFDLKNDFTPLEIAWTSNLRMGLFEYWWCGYWQGNMKEKENRIHPTQKPVALYRWLLHNYAKPGWTILDTHVGSASSLIACESMGFEYVGFELDRDYWEAACKRMDLWRKGRTMDMFEEKKNGKTAEQLELT